MKQIGKKLYNIACIISGILFSGFMGINFFSAFTTTSICNNMTEQIMHSYFDNILISFLTMALFTILFYFVYKLSKKYGKKFNRVLLIIVASEYLVLGTFLVLFGRTIPMSDSATVYWMGDTFSRGSLSMVTPDSYLSYYPQQAGLMIFYGIIIRLISFIPIEIASFHFVKIIYVFITTATLITLYLFVKEVFARKELEALFLLFMATNYYTIIYSSFLYGEVPALLFISIAMLFTAKLYKNSGKKTVNIIMIIVGLTLATFIRKNSIIFTIAYMIVVILICLKKPSITLLSAALIGCVISLLILPITVKILESKSGNHLTSGVTAASYFAMGMQEGGRASGWYNGFNFNTYTDSGYDAEIANEIAKESIKERMGVFKLNPSYAFNFYKDKYLSQWTDGTYASCQATISQYGRIAIVESLYTGKIYPIFVWFSSIYQNMIYLGGLIFSLSFLYKTIKKKEVSILEMLPMIFAFGGFLFHMMWEANSRYIFTYAVLLTIYGAVGMYIMFNYVTKRKK